MTARDDCGQMLAALVDLAREALSDRTVVARTGRGDCRVLPYAHGGTKYQWAELLWHDGAWWVTHDGKEPCSGGGPLTGKPDDLQRIAEDIDDSVADG